MVEANFIPIPHPTKLALFGHKITLYSIYKTTMHNIYKQSGGGGSYCTPAIAAGSNRSRGLSPLGPSL